MAFFVSAKKIGQVLTSLSQDLPVSLFFCILRSQATYPKDKPRFFLIKRPCAPVQTYLCFTSNTSTFQVKHKRVFFQTQRPHLTALHFLHLSKESHVQSLTFATFSLYDYRLPPQALLYLYTFYKLTSYQAVLP